MRETIRLQVDGMAELSKLEVELTNIQTNIRGVKKELKTAFDNKDQAQVDRLTKKYQGLRQEQIKLQTQGTQLRKGIRDNVKAMKEQEKAIPKDSLIGLKRRYKELTEEVGKLSAKQRKSTFGKDVIRETKQVRAEISKVEQSYGQFGRNVGNYRSALGGVGRNILGSLGIVGGIQAGVQVLRNAAKITTDYEQANANLNAILGVTADKTEDLRVQQQQLGATTAFTASDVAELQTELSKLGFTQDEIISSTASIIDFSVATQTEVPRAAKLAGAALRAFNLEAEEMDRVVSVLGVSTTKSALDFQRLETAIPIVGGVAQEFGASIEDVTAQLGVLADRGIDASTAASGLRNIYLRSAKAGLTYEEALAKLQTSQEPVNEALKLFGVRGALQATILALNTEETADLTSELTDLKDELGEMADKQLATVNGQLILLNSAWQGFVLSIEDGSGIISKALKGVIGYLTNTITLYTALNEGRLSFFDWVKAGSGIGRSEVLDRLAAEQETAGVTVGFLKAAEEGAAGWNKENKESSDLIDKVAKAVEELKNAQGELNKENKKQKEIFAEGSIKRMEQDLKDLNEEIERSTDSEHISKLITQQFELSQKIKIAKDEIKEQTKALEERNKELKRQADIRKEMESGVEGLEGVDTGFFGVSTKAIEESDEEYLAKRVEKIREHLNKTSELYNERAEQRKEMELRIREEIEEAVFQSAETINETLFTLAEKRGERELSNDLDRLEAEYDSRLKAAQGSAEARERIQKELEEKKDELKREAFEKDKNRQIAEAIIAGGLAVIQSLAKTALPFPASLTGPAIIAAKTAAQVAIIASSDYIEGGPTSNEGVPDPRYPGRKIVGAVHDEEYVIRKEEIAAFPEEVKRIEQHRVRNLKGFAEGGFTSPIDYEFISRQSSPEPVLNLDKIYEAIYQGAMQGSKSGSQEGIKKGEKDRILRDIREQSARNNIRQ